MANEKRLSLSFAVVKDGVTAQLAKTTTGDLSGDQLSATVQSIGTSWEAIVVTDLASVELIAISNLDATNFVEVAVESAGTNKFAKLTAAGTPKSTLYVPAASGVTFYAKADTAPCSIQVLAVEP